MKKLFITTLLIFVFGLSLPSFSLAHGMMGEVTSGEGTTVQNDNGHIAREETEGKELWQRLQAKESSCEGLSDGNFGALGEYFMGQMMGESHEFMNNMMIRMMGEDDEEQMHVQMGKRMSGCEPDAPMPENMMSDAMMMGESENTMMKNLNSGTMGLLGWSFGLTLMIIFWGLVIGGVIILIRRIVDWSKKSVKKN